VAVAITQWHEQDDTRSPSQTGAAVQDREKSRQARDVEIWHRCSPQKEALRLPGKTNSVVPNRLRDAQTPADAEIVFSDLFEVHLADRTKVRGCLALWKRTRHILAQAFDYRMQADLVASTIEMVAFLLPGMIWHSDQGSKSGAEQKCTALLRKGG
jgi:hypothetical protein